VDWYVVRKDYVSYLSQFDKTVGFVDYGEKLKIHVGTILTIGDFNYYVPISSAKPKHQNMSNSLDFHKLQDKQSGYLYAVLNINNMIPVPHLWHADAANSNFLKKNASNGKLQNNLLRTELIPQIEEFVERRL